MKARYFRLRTDLLGKDEGSIIGPINPIDTIITWYYEKIEVKLGINNPCYLEELTEQEVKIMNLEERIIQLESKLESIKIAQDYKNLYWPPYTTTCESGIIGPGSFTSYKGKDH